MSNIEDDTDAQSQREIVITRVLKAPREVVFLLNSARLCINEEIREKYQRKYFNRH
ncbi:hypothetical protein [Nostoc sp. NMS1]|uniref:hypothetical protein n=1 Tax=Nostoc sp. NMS1 TaxID=2815388 RepID=UPI0025CC40D6|nr:hypothetical protein [Nostoc sp. NMS1]